MKKDLMELIEEGIAEFVYSDGNILIRKHEEDNEEEE